MTSDEGEERVTSHGIPESSGRVVSAGRLSLHALAFTDVVTEIVRFAQQPNVSCVVTANVDHYQKLRKNVAFRAAYARANLRLADGMPIVWLARLSSGAKLERVTGADLLPSLCNAAAETGIRVAFLGGAKGIAEKAADRLVATYPGLEVAGCLSPAWGFDHDEALSNEVINWLQSVKAGIVFVALGAPKQELWVDASRHQLPAGAYVCCGASVDFAADSIARAPRFMQVSGTEWIYRWGQEPRRLTKRYLTNMIFFKDLGLAAVMRTLGRR